jgi:AraC family transcriptional regulator
MTLPFGSKTQGLSRPEHTFFDSGCRRDHTTLLRERAIKQVIMAMREHYMEPLSLQDFANIAQMSLFHFNRVFKSMTGISPIVFLTAIRLEQAKKLLITTEQSVTGICFEVGYRSLGTFIPRFAQFVGIPPTHLRQLAREQSIQTSLRNLPTARADTDYQRSASLGTTVTGAVEIIGPFSGLIFVGIFTNPLPQGQPIGYTILARPGSFYISALPDGQYYVFAVALEDSQHLLSMIQGETTLHGIQGKYPLVIRGGIATDQINLHLTHTSWAEPPVLTVLPCLLLCRYLQIHPLSMQAQEET